MNLTTKSDHHLSCCSGGWRVGWFLRAGACSSSSMLRSGNPGGAQGFVFFTKLGPPRPAVALAGKPPLLGGCILQGFQRH